MGAREMSETGAAVFVALVSTLLGKPVMESLVVLGEMSLRGGLLKVGSLIERLQLAMDNGARRGLLPSENKRDFADIPSDVLDKLQIILYSDPVNVAFRAMGLDLGDVHFQVHLFGVRTMVSTVAIRRQFAVGVSSFEVDGGDVLSPAGPSYALECR